MLAGNRLLIFTPQINTSANDPISVALRHCEQVDFIGGRYTADALAGKATGCCLS
ncbi:hypothetical protein RF657_08865 [Yersinia rochesterensis]|uniref:hypothetical protein n=1 Tax=Yersinia rochesterensis TaxID=1604335 RepID=UPI0025ADDFE4|nr:hypothetical protein [Yersinia rochesterensis]MDR5018501.1 hypothetical protein [Yersinia rochesterensis]